MGNDTPLAVSRTILKNAPSWLSNLAVILDLGHKFGPGGFFNFKYENYDQNYMKNDISGYAGYAQVKILIFRRPSSGRHFEF